MFHQEPIRPDRPARSSGFRNLALASILAVAVGGVAPSAAMAKELTFASYLPPSHLLNKVALPKFFDRVAKESQNDLRFKLVAGAQLFDAKSSISSTGEGLADLTSALSAYVPNQLPHFNILFEMAGYVENPQAGAGAALQTVLLDCETCRADFEKQNTVVIGTYATSSAGLFCSKEVATAADIKGLKIRVSGASGRLVQSMGGTPVRLSPSDLVTSIERGNIDCVLGPLSWLTSYNLYDQIRSIVAFPFGSFPNAISVAFNKDVYTDLSPANKAAVLRSLPSLTAEVVTGIYENGHAAALKKARESGIKIVSGGSDFVAAVKAYRDKDVAVIASNASKFGVKDPSAIIKTFQANIERWNALLGNASVDQARFEQLLWDEVYSKVK